MRKIFMAVAILMVCGAGTAHAQGITVDSKASLLMEAETGKILHEDNAHEKLAPASVTKVMTMLLIYEALDQERIAWDDIVTTSAHAASMGGSQIFLEPEEKQTVRDLVKAIVIASANDAAVAMAEYIAGSEGAFVAQMNAKAAQLGMENTHFVNACGLDAEGHLTTAHDIALMSRELILNYPEVQKYATTRLDKITHTTKRGTEEFGLTNTNRLIRSYPGATGLKTGSTGIAKYCISATAEKDGMHLIAVVLAAPCPVVRFDNAMMLFDYGYANFTLVQKEEAGTEMGQVRVFKGHSQHTPAVIKEQTNMLAPKGKHVELSGEVQLVEFIDAPVVAGQVVGEVIYTWEGAEVGRSDLVVPDDVPKAGAFRMMDRLSKAWLSGG
jgi:D-alanyl-D-alanine carboxypeptidase (penicillin-binding protein 5/6)